MRSRGVIDAPVGLGHHDHLCWPIDHGGLLVLDRAAARSGTRLVPAGTRPLVGRLLSLMSPSSVEVSEA